MIPSITLIIDCVTSKHCIHVWTCIRARTGCSSRYNLFKITNLETTFKWIYRGNIFQLVFNDVHNFKCDQS